MSAREFIERVEALAGAATEGEWWHTGKAATVYGRWADDLSSAPHVANVHDPDDAAFIAASRTVVPQLTAALRAVLDVGPHLRHEHMTPAEARLADGWDSARAAIHNAITGALEVEP